MPITIDCRVCRGEATDEVCKGCENTRVEHAQCEDGCGPATTARVVYDATPKGRRGRMIFLSARCAEESDREALAVLGAHRAGAHGNGKPDPRCPKCCTERQAFHISTEGSSATTAARTLLAHAGSGRGV